MVAPRTLEVSRAGDDAARLLMVYDRFTRWRDLRTALLIGTVLE